MFGIQPFGFECRIQETLQSQGSEAPASSEMTISLRAEENCTLKAKLPDEISSLLCANDETHYGGTHEWCTHFAVLRSVRQWKMRLRMGLSGHEENQMFQEF